MKKFKGEMNVVVKFKREVSEKNFEFLGVLNSFMNMKGNKNKEPREIVIDNYVKVLFYVIKIILIICHTVLR
ncbi:hypothetical protein [Carnobacterium maltaromaticum]|uniref:hypothetical protein n=1 Tax=Carnobacterium maltaromaticum TaxID=2751 RepID=UPI0039B03CC7